MTRNVISSLWLECWRMFLRMGVEFGRSKGVYSLSGCKELRLNSLKQPIKCFHWRYTLLLSFRQHFTVLVITKEKEKGNGRCLCHAIWNHTLPFFLTELSSISVLLDLGCLSLFLAVLCSVYLSSVSAGGFNSAIPHFALFFLKARGNDWLDRARGEVGEISCWYLQHPCSMDR